jgi:hypothetical protein
MQIGKNASFMRKEVYNNFENIKAFVESAKPKESAEPKESAKPKESAEPRKERDLSEFVRLASF